MNAEEYEIMYRVEDTLWWYRGMETISRAMIERHYSRTNAAQRNQTEILDAGCGTGAVMNYLADYGHVTGLDFSPHALRFCQQRGKSRLALGSVMSLPFEPNRFDLISSFDVLCCNGIDDDVALKEFARVLKPGGSLLLRLPAFNWLRGQHDVAVNIRHRYTTAELSQKLAHAGLTVKHSSYANMWLFPFAAFKRMVLERISGKQEKSDLTLSAGSMNSFFKKILSSEAKQVASSGLPFGLTVVALAQKP
jgi:ubiquinone/menaquinone biosynthesis C-methylase UbiE